MIESPPPSQRIAVPNIEQEELRGISRTVAEIEWLLLILVLVYLVFGRPIPDIEPALSMAMFFYAAFVMSFRYANFYKRETRWKIAEKSYPANWSFPSPRCPGCIVGFPCIYCRQSMVKCESKTSPEE